MFEITLFAGNAIPKLAKFISNILNIPLGKIILNHFRDGETHVEIKENVRGRDVFIIQSTCPPTNDNLMELLVMTDALRRASAARITAVIPYFGYARQDRRIRSSRVPITAKLVADMFMTAGVDRIITVDIHAEQIQGFFHIPVDNVYGTPILYDHIKSMEKNCVVVSPDIGGIARARAFAKKIHCDLAIVDKRRCKTNETQVMNIIGDVEDRNCFLIDDIIDTGSTICKAATALKQRGAKNISAYCVHPVLSGKDTINQIASSELDLLILTDSIPLSHEALQCKKIKQVSLAHMLSETIRRVNNEESLSEIFKEYS